MLRKIVNNDGIPFWINLDHLAYVKKSTAFGATDDNGEVIVSPNYIELHLTNGFWTTINMSMEHFIDNYIPG